MSEEVAQGLYDDSVAVKSDVGEGKTANSATSALFPKKWYRIPYFVLEHLSQSAGVQEEEQCRQECESKPKCASFSWNQKTKECKWSLDAIHFDSNYDFFAKTNIKTGAPFTYYEFLGVKYQEAQSTQELRGVDKHACRMKCDADTTKCMSFSYNAKEQLCLLSGSGLHYDSNWAYYEKDQASLPKEWKRGASKEKAAKHAFRSNGAQPSDSATAAAAAQAVEKAKEKKANADAKLATDEEKLASAKESLKGATSSVDKQVAKAEINNAKKEVAKAKKVDASAKIEEDA